MSPSTTQYFVALLGELELVRKNIHTLREMVNRMWSDYIDAEWERRFPKRKSVTWPEDSTRILKGMPDLVSRHSLLKPGMSHSFERLYDLRDVITDELYRVGRSAEVHSSDGMWTKWRRNSSSDYHTQGWGAQKYALGVLSAKLNHATANGLDAEVRTHHVRTVRHRPHSGGGSSEIYSNSLWVSTDAIGVMFLEYVRGPSTRDWIDGCIQSGVNPKVYNPFLPHELVEDGYRRR